MNYTPRPLDPEASDVSRGHDRSPLAELALLTAGVAVIVGAVYLAGVLVTDFVVARISPATEARIFSVFGSSLPQAKTLDPAMSERKAMAERTLDRLVQNADLKGLPIRLIVWDTPQTNAVALPGGTIALTMGLLQSLDEESGMGFVLAHELGHFHGRDHLRGLGRRLGFQLIMGLLFSSGDIRLGTDQAGEFALLAYSRKRESAADRYALDLLYRTLGSAQGATRLFELLSGEKMPGWAYMLNSHPAMEERIAAMRAQVGGFGSGGGRLTGPETQVTNKARPAGTAATARVAPVLRGSQSYLGAVTRGGVDRKRIALTFTAHAYAEGAETILESLKKHDGKGSFFLTGVFVANTNYHDLVRRMVREGHYVGPHSDQHLLYCAWEKARPTLVTREQFRADLQENIAKIEVQQAAVGNENGIQLATPRIFLPPYEHYNLEISEWTREMGMGLVNYTPGTRSNADYTGEADKNFVSSEVIYNSIVDYESKDPHGLNGFILLLHLGSGPGRQDKFHTRIPQLLEHLASRGYEFVTVEELLQGE